MTRERIKATTNNQENQYQIRPMIKNLETVFTARTEKEREQENRRRLRKEENNNEMLHTQETC